MLLGGELSKVGRKVVPVQVGPSPKEARHWGPDWASPESSDQGSQTREGEVCRQAGEKGVGPSHPLRERNRDNVVELGGDIPADRARPVSHVL